MRIVFHGGVAASFAPGVTALVRAAPGIAGATFATLPDVLADDAQRRAYAAAEAVVSFHYDAADRPRPEGLRLFQVPGAGIDEVDLAALPAGAYVCNCYGHEIPIAEYVMAALLLHHVPLADADRRFRAGEWAYRGGTPDARHADLEGRTLGILGWGHIGQAVARRARGLGLRLHVANRSPLPAGADVDRAWLLADLDGFWESADAFAVTLPLAPGTAGIVNAAAFAAMRPHALIVNVGRGPTVDEQALYDALKGRRIGGAVIDTWYAYPDKDDPGRRPSALPFHELDNLVMTPHMSGWTQGTLDRRHRAIADNLAAVARGERPMNVVRPPAV